jgi:hypothetical protein
MFYKISPRARSSPLRALAASETRAEPIARAKAQHNAS